MVHACGPSYLGSRGRKIESLSPAREQLGSLYLKNRIQTKGLEAWLKW
jgi:hypothetical protein